MKSNSIRAKAPYLIVVLFVLAVAIVLQLPQPSVRAQGEESAEATASTDRAQLITAYLDGFSGGTVALDDATGEVREFTLEIHQIESEIAPGVVVEQWAFGLPGEAPSVPGPELRVTEGDLVRITLVNTHTQPHSIHSHGITSLAQQMDGVEATSHLVLPGESFTYEFVASTPGTHAYHCHVQTNLHLDMGMYGPIVVEPRDRSAVVWDKEFNMTIDEWDSRQDPLAALHVSVPDTFLVNGKAFPLGEPFAVAEGETALFRVTNVGYQPHSLHLHGMSFLVIAKDGYDLPQPYRGDTLAISPGERYDLLIKGRDGTFPFHDHIVDNVTNSGAYPGGMLALIAGSEPRVVTDSERSVYHGRDAKPERAAGALATETTETTHDHGDAEQHAASVTTGASAEAAADAATEVVAEGDAEVAIENFAFSAPVLRIAAGSTVTWTNRDVAPHTVTSGLPGDAPAGRAFDSSGEADGAMRLLAQGDSWSHTFDTPGEYDYYCLPHTFMTARVIVE